MAASGAMGGANAPDEDRPDLSVVLDELAERLDAASKYLRLEELRDELSRLEGLVGAPDLWNDLENARKITTAYTRVKADIDLLDSLDQQVEDARQLYEIAHDEGDVTLLEMRDELHSQTDQVGRALDDLELRSLFSGEFDERDAIAEVHAGAGGTDAQDWAEMMLRMYLRWAERRGLSVEIDEVSQGGEAGILSATFVVRGQYAYGLLSSERGVHRLVRMSPFDSQHRRQTSFASFEVTPFLDELEDIVDIDEKDLRIDTYRSSGAGGQHINVTDSAVRITHLPTGIVVSCQNERSQLQNKDSAMKVLKARLYDIKLKEQQAKLEQISGVKKEIAFGHQIRSYVLHPYQLVKDHRTKYETGNVQAVLDGDLDPFIEAFLQWRRARKTG